MTSLTLLAPLAGWCTSLADVPDAVFAEGMIGDGLAIDPTSGVVVAPCDGEITTLPAEGHAVSIRAASGIDVLVHVGIDSVKLGGHGFQPLVRMGQRVRAGEELIRFDLDSVARGTKSLLTPVVVSPVEGLRIVRRHASGPIRAGDVLLEIEGASNVALDAARDAAARTAHDAARAFNGGATASRTVSVPLRHGLHARPAALIAKRARSLGGAVTLNGHGKTADARSVTAIMSLGIGHGDSLTLSASGPNAAAAVDDMIAAIDEALRLERDARDSPAARGNDRLRASPSADAEVQKQRPGAVAPTTDHQLPGVIAVAGFAVGRVARLERTEIPVVEAGSGAAHERTNLERAQEIVRARLTRVGGAGSSTRREIAEAHLAFLEDPLLNEAAHERIANGKSAGFAWRSAIRASIATLEKLSDARLRERADDLLDIESHVLLALTGEARPMNLSLPENAIVVADELLPSELVSLDRANLKAICLAGGGPTSHVAILAAAMDVPMLVGIGPALCAASSAERVIVDAERGVLQLAPSTEVFAEAERRANTLRAQRAAERGAAQLDCRTRDGTRIEVFANLGSLAEAEAAVGAGAEGCGLLRTEFLFIDRDAPPSEAEQLQVYQSMAAALGGRPLVLRLMDVGGDKPLKYLPLPSEENPALGLRGIRTALRHPEILRTQLRAALGVTPAGVVRILLPMITDVAEIRAVRDIVDALQAQLVGSAPVEIGAMIETPAAALTADRIAREVDFLSVGTNDLTQYALAMDRGHPELARRTDALHPAVLKLIALTAAAGERSRKLVAVCGAMAADPAAVALLIGLGVRELSVVPAAIPALKRQVRNLTIKECAALAARCLEAQSAAEVRALTAQAMASSPGDRP